MHTILVWAQVFVPGFFLETGDKISSHDQTNLYYVSSLAPSNECFPNRFSGLNVSWLRYIIFQLLFPAPPLQQTGTIGPI